TRPGPKACTGWLDQPGAPGSLPLIAHGKTGLRVGRPLDLVGECNCEILKGNPAFSVCGGQKLVGPEPELAGPLPGDEQRRRRQEGPFEVLLLPQQVEKRPAFLGFGLVLGRESGGRHQADAGSDLEAAGAADHEIAADPRITGGPDQLVG